MTSIRTLVNKEEGSVNTRGPFDPKYVGDYHVVSLKGNQVEVQPLIGGPMEMKHNKHVKYILPVD